MNARLQAIEVIARVLDSPELGPERGDPLREDRQWAEAVPNAQTNYNSQIARIATTP
jgi:hypothetical protein